MSVIRVEKTRDYTVMSNHHLRNAKLSYRAKGLMSFMLSLPDGWDYSIRGLATFSRDGIDAVRTAIGELERAGYVTRRQTRDELGRMSGNDNPVYEKPVNLRAARVIKPPTPQELEAERRLFGTATPLGAEPASESPTTGSPTSADPSQEQLSAEEATQPSTEQPKEEADKKTEGQRTKKAPPVRHRHGEYENVLLSDADLARLKGEFPHDWQKRIDALSCYMESTGKSYKSHLATIRNWERRDREAAKRATAGKHASYSYEFEEADVL